MAKFITKSALIAAMYVVLTSMFSALAYKEVQFRISEVLVLLVFVNPKYIWGVCVGTFLANLSSPFGIVDAALGTMVSALAMYAMILLKQKIGTSNISMLIGSIFPILFNAIYVASLIIALDGGNTPIEAFVPIAISVATGEFVVVSLVGVLLFNLLKLNKSFYNILSLE